MNAFLSRHVEFIWGVAAGLFVGTAALYAILFKLGVF